MSLYLEVPGTGVNYDQETVIDALVWEMRELLRKKTGVWFEYESKQREVVD